MSTEPKRVVGGVVVVTTTTKKKKKKTQQQQQQQQQQRASISTSATSFYTSHPFQSPTMSPIIQQSTAVNRREINDNDDDDREALENHPNDALLCLQAYTRPGNSETCAYCPIITKQIPSAAVGAQTNNLLVNDSEGQHTLVVLDGVPRTNAHAAPMMPKRLLLYHLVHAPVLSSSSSSSSSYVVSTSASSRTHAERAIAQIASSNDVRLLQLHGTAIKKKIVRNTKKYKSSEVPSISSSSWRGDGNDDDDVVIMETSVYVAAAQMAWQTYHFEQYYSLGNDIHHDNHCDDHGGAAGNSQQLQSRHYILSTNTTATTNRKDIMVKEADAFHWFTNVLLPNFAGKTWFSLDTLSPVNQYPKHPSNRLRNSIHNSKLGDDNTHENERKRKYFHDSIEYTRCKNIVHGNDSSIPNQCSYSFQRTELMIQQLVHAGLLLPRRRGGGLDFDGYWFSLPGLGKAAKSIVDGRNRLLRRLHSSRNREMERTVLEHSIDERWSRNKRAIEKGIDSKDTLAVEQTGKFIVLDLLSKGMIHIHELSSSGEQFVRLSEL